MAYLRKTTELIQRAHEVREKEGLNGLIRKLARTWVYRRDVQLMLTKDMRAGRLRFGRHCKYKARVLRYPDDSRYLQRLLPERAELFETWSRQGVIVVGVIADGAVVAMQALVTGRYHELELNFDFELDHGEWLQFAGWVAPEWRGSCVAVEVLNTCLQYLKDRGVARVLTCVDETNIASLKIMFHTGHKEMGRALVARRWLGYRRTVCVSYSGLRKPELSRRAACKRPAGASGEAQRGR